MNTRKAALLIFTLTLGLIAPGAMAKSNRGVNSEHIADYYHIESIKTPPHVVPEVGGIAFMPDGRLVVCFERGEIYFYNPKTKEWKFFAEGLHDPLGVLAVSNSEILVMQRPELTRVRDTDGDGVADEFEPVTDAFGMSGNYHEFAFGPVRDAKGNLYISLNTASNGDGVRPEVRGEFKANGRQGRMYSAVPYRGWVIQITPEGQFVPFACGFRSPNGLGFDEQGRLFVCDNQGDWLGTSKMYYVQKGHFYGHPSSLVWRPGFEGDPLKLPVSTLEKMRTRAVVLFPHGIMANSPTQPVCDTTGGRFGPFDGQMFVGEMNVARIMRVMLEEVGGQLQGAVTPFYDRAGLESGDNRLAFGPDGSLWVGQTRRDKAWAGNKGIQHITWKGKVEPDVLKMHLTRDGFELTFTRPIDPATVSAAGLKLSRYYYEYHQKYGSPQMDKADVAVKSAALSADHRVLKLTLGEVKAGYIYELHLDPLKAEGGEPVVNTMICYTVNMLAR